MNRNTNLHYDSIDCAGLGAGNPRTLADELEDPVSESAASLGSTPSEDPVRQLTDSEDGFYDENPDEVARQPSHTEARQRSLDSELWLEDSSLYLSPERMTKEESQQFPKPSFNWTSDSEVDKALTSEERTKRKMLRVINKIRKLGEEIEDLRGVGKKTDSLEGEIMKLENEIHELENEKESLNEVGNQGENEEAEEEVDYSDFYDEDDEDSQGSEDGWEADSVKCAEDESLYQTDAHFSRPAWLPRSRDDEATGFPASPSPPPTPSSPFIKQEKFANFSLKRCRPRGPPRLRWKRLRWPLWLQDATGEIDENNCLVEMYSSWYGECHPNARGNDFRRPSGPSILPKVNLIDQGFSQYFGFSPRSSKRRAMSLPCSPKSMRVKQPLTSWPKGDNQLDSFVGLSDSKQTGNAKNILFRDLGDVMVLPRLFIPKLNRPAPRQLSRAHDPTVNWEDIYSPSHDSEYESESSPDPAEVVSRVDKWINGGFKRPGFIRASPGERPPAQLPKRRRPKCRFFPSPVRPKAPKPRPLPYYPGSRLPIPTKVGYPSPPAIPAKSCLRTRLNTNITPFPSGLRKEIEHENTKNMGKEAALEDSFSEDEDRPQPEVKVIDAASPAPGNSPNLPAKEPNRLAPPPVPLFRPMPRRVLHACPVPIEPPPPEALLRPPPAMVRRERNTFQNADLSPLETLQPSGLSTKVHVIMPFLFTTPKEPLEEEPRVSTSSLSNSVSALRTENSVHSVEMLRPAIKAEAPTPKLFGWFKRK